MRTVFDEVMIGGIKAKNRIVRSATWERLADDSGGVTESLLGVYRELGIGEIGMVVTSGAYVSQGAKGLPGQIGIYEDSLIPGLASLAGAIKVEGSASIAQIGYCGNQSLLPTRETAFSPSGIVEPSTGAAGIVMTGSDIESVIFDFAEAARRAREAGFDGVQLHVAHGYLLSQFLSPYHNRRTDGYGGSVGNRCKIVVDIVHEIKRAFPDFPVLLKINGSDQWTAGLSVDDALEACGILSRCGIDAIEVSGGVNASKAKGAIRANILSESDEGYFASEADAIARDVSVPVISVGGYRSLPRLEASLRDSPVAMFSLARPFFAEPALVRRWKSGDLARAKCLSCNRCRNDEGNRCPIFPRLD